MLNIVQVGDTTSLASVARAAAYSAATLALAVAVVFALAIAIAGASAPAGHPDLDDHGAPDLIRHFV